MPQSVYRAQLILYNARLMAFLHPNNLASRNDVPKRLQEVARALRDSLPDEVTVWLERTGDGDAAAAQLEFEGTRRSDTGDVESYLVLLDPQAGILVLEAPTSARIRSSRAAAPAKPKKPSGLVALAGAFRNRLSRGPSDSAADDPTGDPVEQDHIRQMIAERAAQLRRGLDSKSIHTLPVAEALALPNMRAQEAAAISARFGVPVLTEEDFTEDALRPTLQQVIGGHRRQLLTQPEENAARATVNPTIVIDGEAPQMFTAPSPSGEYLIRVLDREQERLARDLGGGYRLIRGVAGSGKTLVLTHRAMYMSRLLPKWRILVLCFNVPLRASLEKELSKHRNVTVKNLDSLAYQIVESAVSEQAGTHSTSTSQHTASGDSTGTGRRWRQLPKPDYDKTRRDALQLARRMDDAQRYDMVLVDEAQDLDSVGLDLAWAMLKPDRGHFVMALDSAQAVYRRKMTWNPPDMTARGRSTVLDVNYRNTEQVLNLGLQILLGSNQQSKEQTSVGNPPRHQPGADKADGAVPDDLNELVMPDKAVRSGPKPEILACADHRAEVEAIAGKVEQLRSRGVAADDIAVLLGSFRIGPFQMKESVTRRVPDAFMVENQNREKAAFISGRVRVASLSILKGLEFAHVIIGAANHIWIRDEPADAQNDDLKRRALYVAITRATESVTIVYSGSGPMSGIKPDDFDFIRTSPDLSEHPAARSVHGENVREAPGTRKPLSRNTSQRVQNTASRIPESAYGTAQDASHYRHSAAATASKTSPNMSPENRSHSASTGRAASDASLRAAAHPRTPQHTPTHTGRAASDASLSATEEARYERLRQWRLERSRADGVPAYVVFNNKVMAEIARRRPVTDAELLKVPGIGRKKLSLYGSDLKKLLAAGQ